MLSLLLSSSTLIEIANGSRTVGRIYFAMAEEDTVFVVVSCSMICSSASKSAYKPSPHDDGARVHKRNGNLKRCVTRIRRVVGRSTKQKGGVERIRNCMLCDGTEVCSPWVLCRAVHYGLGRTCHSSCQAGRGWAGLLT